MTVLLAALLLARPAASWSVNANHTLVWGDKPYLPVGVRIKGGAGQATKALAAGIRDFVVDLPADGGGWAETVGELEKASARYVVAVGTTSPRAKVFAVEPDEYRVPDLEGAYHFNFSIPNADRALVMMVQQTSAAVRWRKVMPIVDGKLKIDDDEGPGAPCVLLVYPFLTKSDVTDFWEPFDGHRDMVLTTLGKFKAGPGFRGLLNPLGSVKAFVPDEPEYVPQSAMFRVELEAFLRKNYPSPNALAQAWSLAFNDLADFKDFARLVPLWNSKRGLPLVYDPDNDQTYGVEPQRSRLWSDIKQVMADSANRRYTNLVDAVQKAVGVPVIEEWRGWGGPYEGAVPTAGVGAVLTAPRIAPLIEAASRPASTILRSPTRFGWATDVALSTGADAASASEVLDTLESIGMRGFFFRCNTDADISAVAALAAKHSDESSQWKPNALYYPEAANDPAAPGRLGSGLWWLPAPIGGDRLDMGENLEGYLFKDSQGPGMAIWSRSGTQKVGLKVNDPAKLTFQTTDGSTVASKLKKQILEVDIPTSPVIIRGYDVMPVPMEDYTQSLVELRAAVDNFPRIADTEGDALYKIKQYVDGFDRSPDISYRLMKQHWRQAAIKIAPYVWLEAEKTPDLLFASRGDLPGASDGKVLVLGDKLGAGGRSVVTFPVTPHQQGNHEVWIAAKVDPGDRDAVMVRLGARSWALAEPPVSYYGAGLAWFKVGEVELRTPEKLSIATTRQGVQIQVDVVMVSPTPFRPRGPRPPVEFIKTLLEPEKKKGKGKGSDGA
ncbi:MAG: hypothetical protein JSS65_06380 [Armatimonadetes bacterium]|nr:hypothetical protein [Armatimonadota bacterium]